jgi:outer membrane protein assembly factor BamB
MSAPNLNSTVRSVAACSPTALLMEKRPGKHLRRVWRSQKIVALRSLPRLVRSFQVAVFSGSVDGHMRAYGTEDGKVIWEFDAGKEFKTVNYRLPANGWIRSTCAEPDHC